jgi:hypothetical protein
MYLIKQQKKIYFPSLIKDLVIVPSSNFDPCMIDSSSTPLEMFKLKKMGSTNKGFSYWNASKSRRYVLWKAWMKIVKHQFAYIILELSQF